MVHNSQAGVVKNLILVMLAFVFVLVCVLGYYEMHCLAMRNQARIAGLEQTARPLILVEKHSYADVYLASQKLSLAESAEGKRD